jgi:hypothetical protein
LFAQKLLASAGPVVDFSAQCVACQIFRAFEENPQLVIQLIAINGFPAEAVPR